MTTKKELDRYNVSHLRGDVVDIMCPVIRGENNVTTNENSVILYNKYGFDRDGFDRDGFDYDGFDHNGFNRNGFDRDGCDYSGERPS